MTVGNIMVLACVVSVIVDAQGVRPPKPDKSETSIQGCLHGRTLKVTKADTTGSQSHTFRLRIPKSLATALKEHERHEEELVGVLRDTEQTMGGSTSKGVGSRTKITVGASEERNTGAAEDPQLDVTSFRHIASTCGA